MEATQPTPGSLEERLKAAALEEGFLSAGIGTVREPEGSAYFESWLGAGFHGPMTWLAESAAVRRSVDSVLPGARSYLAVALSYAAPRYDRQGVRIARYAVGRDYHKIIRAKLRRVAALLPGKNRVCVDSAPLFEREMAHRAGLGWFGKNTCLIDSKRGSWFLLGFLLTDVSLEPDAASQGGCGTCHACIDACPTGAIVMHQDRWAVDSRKCISSLTIEHRGPFDLGDELHGWTFGCDVCQEVCPFNHPNPKQPSRAAPAAEPELAPRDLPSLQELAELEFEEWDTLTRGSALRRAGHAGLVRNARANLRCSPSE